MGETKMYVNLDNMYNVDELSDAVDLIRELRDEVRTIRKQLDLFVQDREDEIEREANRWNGRFG